MVSFIYSYFWMSAKSAFISQPNSIEKIITNSLVESLHLFLWRNPTVVLWGSSNLDPTMINVNIRIVCNLGVIEGGGSDVPLQEVMLATFALLDGWSHVSSSGVIDMVFPNRRWIKTPLTDVTLSAAYFQHSWFYFRFSPFAVFEISQFQHAFPFNLLPPLTSLQETKNLHQPLSALATET